MERRLYGTGGVPRERTMVEADLLAKKLGEALQRLYVDATTA